MVANVTRVGGSNADIKTGVVAMVVASPWSTNYYLNQIA